MEFLRVGVAALNQTPLDWRGNTRRILQAMEEAREKDVRALCLPELCISGYGCEDAFYSPSTLQKSLECLQEILARTENMLVCLGLPLAFDGKIYNVAAVLWNQSILGISAKRFLASEGIHYEPRWFTPWDKNRVEEISVFENKIPLGDLTYQLGDLTFGCEICEDGWRADRPALGHSKRGASIIFSLNASPFAMLKHHRRTRHVVESSRLLEAVYIYSNLLGCESGRILFDGGTLIANAGKLVASSARMGLREFYLLAADIPGSNFISKIPKSTSQGWRQNLIYSNAPSLCVERSEALTQEPVSNWEQSSNLKEEEFSRMTTLGLFDYLKKTKSHGFMVSLSGGADSTTVACLVSLCLMRALQELGQEGLAASLSHIPGIKRMAGYTGMVRELFLCAYQATRNSSRETFQSAKILCRDLKIPFLRLDVDQFYEDYVQLISSSLNGDLSWEKDDLCLQNIQARVRAPGIWLLANKKNFILLSTSNRSEASVGYATMDGDTCGGLAPISGVDKSFIRNWLIWMETNGPDGLGRFPILRIVNELEPSAELRPRGQNQQDEKDLMPYEILNAIEQMFLVDRHSPREIFLRLSDEYQNLYAPSELKMWVKRFFTLWARNQWKRERIAPGFHLDNYSLDPKSACRFPIFSGGFEVELMELDQESISGDEQS